MNFQLSINRVPRLRDQAETSILSAILDGSLPVGSKLPPIREFGDRLGVSFRTVQQALESLERKGFIRMRHGSGTYVESVRPATGMRDAVVLCIETHDHVFGELAGMLTRRLNADGRLPSMIDTRQKNCRDLIMQTARSEAGIFVIHGGGHFHTETFRRPEFAEKRLIGIVDWADAALAERMSLALVDSIKGGERVAQHLFAAGHRRVLMVGTETLLRDPGRHGTAFRAVWDGTVDEVRIAYTPGDAPSLDVHAAAALLRGPDAPTAVFGLRDYDVVCLHKALLAEGIDLHRACEVIGYGDTPWSRSPVVFSTVDWNLDSIAEETCRLIGEADRDSPPRHVMIEPHLVLR